MIDRFKFLFNRIRERLWVRPLLVCMLSVAGVLLAKAVEHFGIFQNAPDVSPESLNTLLSILSASMLVIATFAVGSMVASYASASGNATPRTFPLVISDDVSQNALSIFIGAFIFSVVALIAAKNDFFESPGRFILFVMTILTFAVVILTFVRWMDRIARLGRLGATIDKVESVTAVALKSRRRNPTLGCRPIQPDRALGEAVCSDAIGYVQRINVSVLQGYAEQAQLRIRVEALPGTFCTPDRPIAYVVGDAGTAPDIDNARIEKAFVIGHDRTFDEDPRFGLVVLAEIAGRALSPAVNDPGTAIDITGTLVRLLAEWNKPLQDDERVACHYDRIEMPELAIGDMFDDAFTAIARDGAGSVEVASRLQKALQSLADIGDAPMREAAIHHSRLALARAEKAMALPQDVDTVRRLADFSSHA